MVARGHQHHLKGVGVHDLRSTAAAKHSMAQHDTAQRSAAHHSRSTAQRLSSRASGVRPGAPRALEGPSRHLERGRPADRHAHRHAYRHAGRQAANQARPLCGAGTQACRQAAGTPAGPQASGKARRVLALMNECAPQPEPSTSTTGFLACRRRTPPSAGRSLLWGSVRGSSEPPRRRCVPTSSTESRAWSSATASQLRFAGHSNLSRSLRVSSCSVAGDGDLPPLGACAGEWVVRVRCGRRLRRPLGAPCAWQTPTRRSFSPAAAPDQHRP